MSETELKVTFVGPAFDDRSNEANYISRDTVWFEGVGEVAAIPPEDHRAFHGPRPNQGKSARRSHYDDERRVGDGTRLPNAATVPFPFEGWAPFTEGCDDIRRGFGAAGMSSRLRLLDPRQSATETALTARARHAQLYALQDGGQIVLGAHPGVATPGVGGPPRQTSSTSRPARQDVN